jgi:serine/threonine protein kinase/Tfp pilus assembly protein PilF
VIIGKTISHYKITEKLGEGGMGEVYLADDLKLERQVAIKFLPEHLTKDKENVERFKREAKAAAALNHPNIVTIYDVIEEEDQICIVMEYVDGKSLREILNTPLRPPLIGGESDISTIPSSEFRVPNALKIITQIAEGLSEAHKADIIHRDIKPENILIDSRGRVKILDFGLAKLKGISKLTKETSTLGTIHYMSPEQLQGKEVDNRSDIWSLGVVLYEMFTGEVPFKGEYEQAVIYAILNEDVKLSSTSQTNISNELVKIVSKCLQKNSADRYQSIQEFLENLIKYQKGNKADKSNTNHLLSKRTITFFAILVAMILLVFIFISIQSKEKKEFDSIAVLPLKNISGNPDQEYFSDGMTEALITELSKLKSLKVISRTSIMQFKETDKTLPEIAEELNVNVLVEGSALIIGNQVKITAQLIDAEQDQHLWAEDYVRDLRDILLLHKEVARTIALQVKSTLLPEEKLDFSEAKKVNPRAYEAYLKGKFYLHKFTKSDAEKAVQFFNSALKHQNDFALAYAGLAEAYNIMSCIRWISSKSGWMKSKEMALKALDIDNGLAEAHTMLAEVKYIYEWDWEGAEIEYKKAIEINPNYSTAHSWYAVFLSSMERHEEAIAEIKIAQELDPLFIRVKVTASIVFRNARQYERAEDQLLKLIHINAELPLAHFHLGKLYLITRRYEDAIFEIEKAFVLAKDSTRVPRLAQAYALKGNKIKARQLLDYWLRSKQEDIQSTEVALIYFALGEKEKTFEWLQKAYDLREIYLNRLKVDPRYDPIRNDKRYIDLLKKIGLTP